MKNFIFLSLCAVASLSYAGPFDDLRVAEQENIQAQKAEQARLAQEAKIEADRIAKENAKAAALEARRAHELRIKNAETSKLIAQKKAKEQERNTRYEDDLRELEIAEKKLRLKAIETRVNRENDFIDSQLNREKAKTDVVQSEADVRRNVSSGVKSYMTDKGKSEVQEIFWRQLNGKVLFLLRFIFNR